MLIDALKKSFPSLDDLRVREVIVNKLVNKVNCVLSYPEYDKLDKSLRDEVCLFVKKSLPEKFDCNTVFVNDYFSTDGFLSYFFKIVHEHFAVLAVVAKQNFSVVASSERSFILNMHLTSLQQLLVEQCNFVSEFKKRLSEFSCYTVKIEISNNDVAQQNENLVDMRNEQYIRMDRLNALRPQPRFIVTKRIKYIGSLVEGQPRFIADINENRDNVTVSGKIVGKKTTVSKNDPLLHIYKFTLQDESGTIDVVFFLHLKVEDAIVLSNVLKNTENASKAAEKNKKYNDKKIKQLFTLCEGTDVIVRGRAVLNKYSNKFEVQGFDLSKCDRVQNTVKKLPPAIQPHDYTVAFPKLIETSEQLSIDEVAYKVPKEFQTDVVLCSMSVTGYNVYKDRILAVCMSKISNGKLVEVLSVLLNPEKHIPVDSLIDFGIEDQNILSCPTMVKVISDLYKFSYGCVIVGEEIFKTLNLLKYYGQSQGFYFDNPSKHLNDFFEELHTTANLSRRPKFNVLSEVAKFCQVQCSQASKIVCFQHNKLATMCVERFFELIKKANK